MKILLPDTLRFDLAVPADVEQVTYAVDAPVPAEHADAEVLVLWGGNGEALRADARLLRDLKLVQALPAGPDFLPRLGFAEHTALANGVGLHGPMVSEHAMALTLALLRRIPELLDAQRRAEWLPIGGMQHDAPASGQATTLRGARVVVWGFGDLGQSFARHAVGFGADIVGIARTAGERGGFRVTDDPASVLPTADVVVLCLPSSETTRHVLDADRFATLRRGVLLVNVGRGDAIDEAALVAAVRAGTVAGAGLDVFESEPLAADSELWGLPNVIITPHTAGGRPIGYDELISRQVHHLLAGEPLENLIQNR